MAHPEVPMFANPFFIQRILRQRSAPAKLFVCNCKLPLHYAIADKPETAQNSTYPYYVSKESLHLVAKAFFPRDYLRLKKKIDALKIYPTDEAVPDKERMLLKIRRGLLVFYHATGKIFKC